MKRMKTFLMYLLVFVGFIFLSFVLEDGLLLGMYDAIEGTADTGSYTGMQITDLAGKACRVNGYLSFKLKNESYTPVNCYGKIELYSKQKLLAATEYVEISNFGSQEEKDYQVKFKADEIESYKISLVSTVPDKTNIINILGWEIDLTNVFGMDLSETTIFGVKLTELFNWNNLKTAGGNAWDWIQIFLSSVPWWGYAIGWYIVLWNLPRKFLFGIFPL